MAQRAALTLFLCLALAGAGAAQELAGQLFGKADEIAAQAREAGAALLSPDEFRRGTEDLARAREQFEEGRNLDRIRRRIDDASETLQRAIDNAQLARLTLKTPLASRAAAQTAETAKLAPELWREAERTFLAAARRLERGDLDDARALGEQAHREYRNAELTAIKARHLSVARQLLREADEQRVDRYAPLTLGLARSLLADADAALTRDRYAIDEPIQLAARASYEARHAMHLAKVVRQIAEGEVSEEQVLLDAEKPLAGIAAELGVETDFSAGLETPGRDLKRAAEKLKGENSALRNELGQRNVQIAGLEDEIRELDARLGGASRERSALVRRLENQRRTREQFEQIENLFTDDEALVLRDSSNITVRLVGLNFPSGSAKFTASSQPILEKLGRAVRVFPRSELIVEGHTDSLGADDFNLRLSQDRADAVMNYIIRTLRIPDYRVRAVGYGESRPIANNESADGRARNRRIDLVIVPPVQPGN